MTAEIGPQQFSWDMREIARSSQPSDLALTVARMLAAFRLCPTGQEGVLGFLDQSRELTKADWLALVKLLAKGWRSENGGRSANPFDQPAEQPPDAPGALEQLRRLVLACLFQGRMTPSIPPWLLQSVIDLARPRNLFAGGLDPDVQKLVIEAVSATRTTRVFCAYDGAVDIAVQIAADGADVTLDIEQQDMAALCSCLAIAADLRLHVRRGDPLELARADISATPLLPDTYDASVVVPPFGMRYQAKNGDTLGTNLPAPTSIEAAGVTLALARGSEVGLCLLPPSFLFRASKADQAFKERAICDYGLDTVVGLPRGVFGGSGIAGALVLFKRGAAKEKRGRHPQEIFMIDARGERDGIGPDTGLPLGLTELIRSRVASAISVSVPLGELGANDFNLSVERYVLSPEALRMRELTAATMTVPLDDIVEFYRPQAVPSPKETAVPLDTAAEVGVSDIDEAGLVRSPGKQIAIAPDVALQARRARLEPGDIVMVIKGSVGKVGFVREIPGDATWLASQSFVILRLRRRALMTDPRVLFRFLSSSLGQTTIQSLRVGSAVPGLQMADVRRLPIIIPEPNEQDGIARDVEGLFLLQDQIQELRSELADRQTRIWPDERITAGPGLPVSRKKAPKGSTKP